MISYEDDLYQKLSILVETNEAFYRVDQELDGIQYQIFTYRLASYTEFLLPGALECRGVMFRIDNDDPHLVAIPMQKFFNVNENPLTMNLDFKNVVSIEDKVDGSLISTFIHKGRVRAKSKASLFSDQAVAATNYIQAHPDFERQLLNILTSGCTVNLEWVSPDNRIVLGYEDDALIILNVRSLYNGSYIERKVFEEIDVNHTKYNEVLDRWSLPVEVSIPVEQFVCEVQDMKDIEGFVLKFANGLWTKIKTKWYLARHRCIDSIKSPRLLYDCVLHEATDDMRVLFERDPVAIKKIEDMEVFVAHTYNHMVATVETFYNQNKHLDRKDYAIKGKSELDGRFFGLAMNLYLGKTNSYKDYMSKNFKKFGIKDEEYNDE